MDLRRAVSTLVMETGLPSDGQGGTVHFHKELAGAGKTELSQLDFQVFATAIILDRNSQVVFH